MASWWAEAFITPTGIASSAVVGTPTAMAGVVVIEIITTIPSQANVNAPVVIGPLQTITPTTIASGAVVGTPVIGVGLVGIEPVTIASSSAVGEPTVQPGPVTVTPTTIGSQSAVGSPIVNVSGQVPYTVPFEI